MPPGPAARKGDPITHDGLVPCGVIGPPLTGPCPGFGQVLIEFLPAAHMNCTVACTGVLSAGIAHPPPPGPPLPIILGSMTVLIHGMPAARWTPAGMDTGACGVFLGNPAMAATRTVIIGDSGGGAGGGGAGAGGEGGDYDDDEAAPGGMGAGGGASGKETAVLEPPPKTEAPPAVGTHFVDVRLEHEDGTPFANEKYEITTPDGKLKKGRLDANGFVRVSDIAVPGECQIRFPDLGKTLRKGGPPAEGGGTSGGGGGGPSPAPVPPPPTPPPADRVNGSGLLAAYNAHTHTTAVGPSGPPVPPGPGELAMPNAPQSAHEFAGQFSSHTHPTAQGPTGPPVPPLVAASISRPDGSVDPDLLLNWLNGHTHPTNMGPSGPPVPSAQRNQIVTQSSPPKGGVAGPPKPQQKPPAKTVAPKKEPAKQPLSKFDAKAFIEAFNNHTHALEGNTVGVNMLPAKLDVIDSEGKINAVVMTAMMAAHKHISSKPLVMTIIGTPVLPTIPNPDGSLNLELFIQIFNQHVHLDTISGKTSGPPTVLMNMSKFQKK